MLAKFPASASAFLKSDGTSWRPLVHIEDISRAFVAILIIFFYAHYVFASITAHMLAMFPPFVAVLIGIGLIAVAAASPAAAPAART